MRKSWARLDAAYRAHPVAFAVGIYVVLFALAELVWWLMGNGFSGLFVLVMAAGLAGMVCSRYLMDPKPQRPQDRARRFDRRQ